MPFKIIPKVLSIRILYDVANVVTAARIRDALGKLTNNNREVLVIQMGPRTQNCSDLDLHIFESKTEIRIEDLQGRPKHAKLFSPEKIDREVSLIIAKYILGSYGLSL